MTDSFEVVSAYLRWLGENTAASPQGEWTVVTVPFLDRHNDQLQIFVRRHPDGFELTDDGYVLSDLESSGVTLSTPRREWVSTIARRFGVQLQGSELSARASGADVPYSFHALLQAMLAIGHQASGDRKATARSFPSEVREYLESLQLPLKRGTRLQGRSGLTHQFDYVLTPPGGRHPRVVAIIGAQAREKLRRVVLGWNDVRERNRLEEPITVIVDDRIWPLPQELFELCQSNGVRAIPWSARNDIAAALMQ